LAVKRYSKKQKSQRGFVFASGFGICLAVAIALCIGIGATYADTNNTNSLLNSRSSSDSSTSQASSAQDSFDDGVGEGSMLTMSTVRDVSAGIDALAQAEEAERLAKEEAARVAEEKRLAEEAANQALQKARQGYVEANAVSLGLDPVDFSIGQDAFVALWTARIDNYLSGSPLAGQGVAFAEAAWKYGVDPRWSPAIANTESSKGLNCFLSHNAWGWGQTMWPNWSKAIDAHVKGLAEGYDGCMTYSAAKKYCPPNYDFWYRNTLSEMSRI
jgi:hypothetical protein